jgi:flagellar biosynthesis GTPase FlhF
MYEAKADEEDDAFLFEPQAAEKEQTTRVQNYRPLPTAALRQQTAAVDVISVIQPTPVLISSPAVNLIPPAAVTFSPPVVTSPAPVELTFAERLLSQTVIGQAAAQIKAAEDAKLAEKEAVKARALAKKRAEAEVKKAEKCRLKEAATAKKKADAAAKKAEATKKKEEAAAAKKNAVAAEMKKRSEKAAEEETKRKEEAAEIERRRKQEEAAEIENKKRDAHKEEALKVGGGVDVIDKELSLVATLCDEAETNHLAINLIPENNHKYAGKGFTLFGVGCSGPCGSLQVMPDTSISVWLCKHLNSCKGTTCTFALCNSCFNISNVRVPRIRKPKSK